MTMTRPFLGFALVVVLLAAGCSLGRSWGLTAYNNDQLRAVLVRVETEAGSNTWRLEAQQLDTLLRGDRQLGGTVTLLDPDTCEVLASETFEPSAGVLVLFHRGVTGDGPWEIDSGVEEVGESPPLASIGAECQPA